LNITILHKSEGLKFPMHTEKISAFAEKVRNELFGNIVPFWMNYTQDKEYGGFYGRITNNLHIAKQAHKGLILTARILWTFSALFQERRDPEFFKMAKRAYDFLITKFLDKKFGGLFWMVDYKGDVVIEQKKIYGQAFSIYALAEFFAANGEQDALDQAISIFKLVEKYNYDSINRGYFETSNRDWTLAEEMRLSKVDMDEKKSMNTHLHLLEAYTTLYRHWKNPELKAKLKELLEVFLEFIIDKKSHHFKLFFDEQWHVKSKAISFGHDIEGSWLLCEAAEELGYSGLLEQVRSVALQMAEATIRDGFDKRYAIFSEQSEDGDLVRKTDWWQQAEAIVGFVNAFQLTNEPEYLDRAIKGWDFIESNFVDRTHGEWFYEIGENGEPNDKQYKVSEWKGPYHNGRACLEILRRLA